MINNNPLFIVFEGIDGSGKTTHIELLKEKFDSQHLNVIVESEPSNGPIGSLIQKIMKGKIETDDSAIAALFLADRLNHINHPLIGLKKRLADGFNVLCSRYYFSNYAFQSETVPLQWLVDCNSLCKSFLKPDLIFYLNVDPVKSYERILNRGKQIEIYEHLDKLVKTHKQYLKAFKEYGGDENIFLINGDNSIGNIHDEIWSLTKQKLMIGKLK